MDIKGAIFDLDGTLLDSMEIWYKAASTYIISQGKVPEDGIDTLFLNMSLVDSSNYIKKNYNIPLSAKEVQDGINALVEDFYFNKATTKEGIPSLLETFSKMGVKMSVATATDRYMVEATLKRNNIRQYFCDILTSTEVGSSKDKPDIYEAALKSINVDKDKTIVFEDLLLGINTAKKAGFTVAGIYDKYSEETQQEVKKIADWYITDYNEWIKKEL